MDAALLLFAPAVLGVVYAAKHGAVDPALYPAINEGKAWLSKGLELRLVLPFADFLTTGDFIQRLLGPMGGDDDGGNDGSLRPPSQSSPPPPPSSAVGAGASSPSAPPPRRVVGWRPPSPSE